MKLKNFLIMMICALSFATGVNAQVNDLSESDLNELTRQAKNKVDQFNDYISVIAKKKKYQTPTEQIEDNRNKDAFIKQALVLFIGGGYQSKDVYGNIIPAPTMETSVLKRNGSTRITTRTIPEYLKHMKQLNYSEVMVKASDAHFTSDVKKVSDKEYQMTLSYAQIYIGKRGEVTVYTDKTRKTIVVHVERYVKDGHTRWTVLLGNVKVDATEAIGR